MVNIIAKGNCEDLKRYDVHEAMIYSAKDAIASAIRRSKHLNPKQVEFRLWFDADKWDVQACVEQIEKE